MISQINSMDTLNEGERPDNIDKEGGMPEDLTLPPKRYEKLDINGHEYDLRKQDDIFRAMDRASDYRQDLREGDLDEYEGKSTEPWGGGRSRLLYDEIRIKMAIDYHQGKHDISWEQQDAEAKRIIKIRATQFRTQGN